jgi:hypothetical protein
MTYYTYQDLVLVVLELEASGWGFWEVGLCLDRSVGEVKPWGGEGSGGTEIEAEQCVCAWVQPVSWDGGSAAHACLGSAAFLSVSLVNCEESEGRRWVHLYEYVWTAWQVRIEEWIGEEPVRIVSSEQ